MLEVPRQPIPDGLPGDGFAYDNERPRHALELAAFRIDRAPVTNAAYYAFVADGGYRRRELWSDGGLGPPRERGLGAAALLDRRRRRAALRPSEVELEPALPAMHVSWYEADAFARWRGARLPTEAEWERAARSMLGDRRGHLDQLDFGPGPAGPFVGDCWEWTATDFGGYPGFSAFPYREYSEVFFRKGYKVLRGASWATRPRVRARPSATGTTPSAADLRRLPLAWSC